MTIAKNAVIAEDVKIGTGVVIEDYVVIESGVVLEDNCFISTGAKIGARPFYVDVDDRKFGVLVKKGAFIGCYTVIQRGIERDTVIGSDCRINNSCNIGHDVILGDRVKIGLNSSCSGFSELGDDVYLGPGTTVSNRARIGRRAFVGIGSLVIGEIVAHSKVVGRPAKEINSTRSALDKKLFRDMTLIRKLRAALSALKKTLL